MRAFYFGLCVLFFSLLASCGGNTAAESVADAAAVEHLPTNPEDIIRRYQAYVDSNLFDQAQHLSTPRSAPLHEMMAAIVADTPFDSSLIHTEFLSINCTENQDTVICNCLLKDEYEEYNSKYILVKMDGRWLVDLPEDEGDIELFEQESLEEWPEKQ